MKRRRTARKSLEDECSYMEPLVDVVFLLLVFFLFTFQLRAMEYAYSAGLASEGKARAETPVQWVRVHVLIRDDGKESYLVDGQSINDLEALKSVLKVAGKSDGSCRGAVFPMGEVPFESVMKVVELVRSELSDAYLAAVASPAARTSPGPGR